MKNTGKMYIHSYGRSLKVGPEIDVYKLAALHFFQQAVR